MSRSHLPLVQAMLGAVLLAAGLAATPATAAAAEPKGEQETAPPQAPPAGFRTWEELAQAQDRLNNAADAILSQAAAGYAGTVAAPESGGLDLYFKGGAVPADVIARAERTGVSVRYLSARYTEEELLREVTRVGADRRATSVAPNYDGSGITITASNDADAEALRAGAQLATTVNVDRPPQMLYNRQTDVSPYWGGARWYNMSSGKQCTTGFGVLSGTGTLMLTAGHCGNNLHAVRIGTLSPLATITADVDTRDTLMITPPSGGTYQGRIYVGGPASSASLKVIGSAVDYVGNWVCTSGSFSGEQCGARIKAVNTSLSGVFPLTSAAATGRCLALAGDSGAPVFHRGVSSSPSILGAVGHGTVSAGGPSTPCVTGTGSGLILGSTQVWYAPLRRPTGDWTVGSLVFYGVTLL